MKKFIVSLLVLCFLVTIISLPSDSAVTKTKIEMRTKDIGGDIYKGSISGCANFDFVWGNMALMGKDTIEDLKNRGLINDMQYDALMEYWQYMHDNKGLPLNASEIFLANYSPENFLYMNVAQTASFTVSFLEYDWTYGNIYAGTVNGETCYFALDGMGTMFQLERQGPNGGPYTYTPKVGATNIAYSDDGMGGLYVYGAQVAGHMMEVPTNVAQINTAADILKIRQKVVASRDAGTSIGPKTLDKSVKYDFGESYSVEGNHLVVTSKKANYNMYSVSGTSYTTPIVLDLSGEQRLDTTSGQWLPHPNVKFDQKYAVLFDIDGNGFERFMEWIGPKNAFLVMPKADGTIDGTCLFGVAEGYDSGFEKLMTLDTNGDKRISGKELEGLYVWHDKNCNGIVDAGELKTVQEHGITQFNLVISNMTASFVQNGQLKVMWDWWPNTLSIKKVK